MNTTLSTEHHHSETRHHHHHHSSKHGMDDSEIFKQKQLRARKFKKTFIKVLYNVMIAAAVLIMMGVFYAYFID